MCRLCNLLSGGGALHDFMSCSQPLSIAMLFTRMRARFRLIPCLRSSATYSTHPAPDSGSPLKQRLHMALLGCLSRCPNRSSTTICTGMRRSAHLPFVTMHMAGQPMAVSCHMQDEATRGYSDRAVQKKSNAPSSGPPDSGDRRGRSKFRCAPFQLEIQLSLYQA